MNIKLTLGERLKDLRVERNLKLETLAEQTGLSKSALSKYEKTKNAQMQSFRTCI